MSELPPSSPLSGSVSTADVLTGDSPHMSNLRVAGARGGAAGIVSQLVKLVVGFGALVVLARLLTPEDFGLVAMVVAVTGFLSLFRELGLSTATVQAKTVTTEQISSLFWLNTVAGLVLTLLTLGIAPAIARFYGQPQLATIAMVLAPATLMSAASSQHRALLRRDMRFTELAVIDVVGYVLSVTIGIAMAATGAGYLALAAMPVVVELCGAIGSWTTCHWVPRRHFSLSEVRPLLLTGRDVVGFDIVNYWARNLDDLLIGRYWGAAVLGTYSRAYQLMMLPILLISTPIGSVALSTLSRIGNPALYRATSQALIQKIALLTLPFAIIMIGAADWVVDVLLGKEWASATPILRALGIAAVTQPIGHTAGWLLITQDRSQDLLRWGLIGGSIAAASILVGLPWGAFGVALSYALSGVLFRTPLLFWYVGRRGPLSPRHVAQAVIVPFVAALISLAALLSFRAFAPAITPVWGLAIACGIVSAVGIGVLLTIPSGRTLLRSSISLVRLALGPSGSTA